MQPRDDELYTLHRRVGELEEENRALKEFLAPAPRPNSVIRMWPTCWRVVRIILRAAPGVARHDRISIALFDHCEDPRKSMHVCVLHARRALAPLGIEIKNAHGEGYYFERGDADKLRAILQEADAE
jgi:hypothetical protein